MNWNIQIRKDLELTREEIESLIEEKKNLLNEIESQLGKGSNYFSELSEMALLQLEIEQYNESENNFLTCLSFFKKQNDRLGQAAVLGVMGTLYLKKGAYSSSIDSYENARRIYEELKQIKEQITCLMGIGNALMKLNRLQEACDSYLECAAICSDNNDMYGLLDCLGNLIYIHETQDKWDVVYELYKKTLKAFKELHDIQGIITSYFNLGLLQKNKNREEALRYFKKGTNYAIDANYSDLIIKGLSYVAETLFYLGNIRKAKDQLIKALFLAENVNAKNATLQIKILLKSFGLNDEDIDNELDLYKNSKKN
ncbi:MAG: hypothetical protein ACFFBP_11995 [Promethearchaeota archaeon]